MMKQKCLRNRDVVNEDRISELPEALLLKILSSVPTKNVIATSVLSKEWRSLWKMVPNLMFNFERHVIKHHRFSEIVFRSLLSHKAPVLESLHLVVRDESEALDVIGISFAHNVRKLVLNLRTGRSVSFPNVLWSCDNTTLEALELKNSILLKFPSPVGFKSLKKLHLDYVIFYDEESVSNLFSGCPRLEDLFVNTRGDVEVETFTVDVPSLQRLTIVDFYGDDVARCVIIAPSLKYLNISAQDWIESCLINAPEVVEAKIDVGHSIENENILASLVSVKDQVSYWYYLPPAGIFGAIYRNLLPLMLESSPKLQILKLTDPVLGEKDWHDAWEWSEPKRVPECLLFQLETFVWTGYEWQREEEKEVALYILKNARRLKKAFISVKYIKPAKLQKLEKTRDESLFRLEKRREALEKLEKRREALEKLEKKREEALQKSEKRRDALQKLEKRREESLQKLGRRREESLQKLEKRREALEKLDKRLEEALEKLDKRLEEALVKLEKRRVEALEKLASEVKVYNSSCHLVLKCEKYPF